MQIHKASGFIENYHPDKLQKYLRKINLPEDYLNALLVELEQYTYRLGAAEMTSHQLRHWVATALLRLPQGQMWQARYLLKEAVYKLGPEGHYFEQFVGRIFTEEGYDVKVGTIMQGKCVTHEVDVYARKDNHQHYMECKFHNKEGIRSDIVTALYSHARFRDLHNGNHIGTHVVESGWLATNTKLTDQALDYSRCVNMQVLSLTLPNDDNITHKVFAHQLYPVTSISSFTDQQQHMLLAEGVILAREFLEMPLEKLQRLQISEDDVITARSIAQEILV
jgi:hypothetical protein